VFAWILGLGALLLAIYATSASGTDAVSGVNVLFGSVFGISRSSAIIGALVGLGVSIGTVAIARPLLFASIDDAVASARRVPVRTLGFIFLALVGVTAAAATQLVGALLLLGLLAAPAGAAQRLTARPFRAMWLSAGVSILSVWVGLTVSYAAPKVIPSFAILATATGFYALSFLATATRSRMQRGTGDSLVGRLGAADT
jgi:zinc/manganese transport system permease protein